MSNTPTIGLLFESSIDRQLIGDFLSSCGYQIYAEDLRVENVAVWQQTALIIASAASARRCASLLLKLKQQTTSPLLPILIALPKNEAATQWLQAGFDDVLHLPITKIELRARLKVFLRLREHLVEQRQFDQSLLTEVLWQMPAGVVIAEASTNRLIHTNSQAADYRDWQGWNADGRPLAADQWPLARSIWRGETIRGEEVLVQRSNGHQTINLVSSAPVHNSSGRIVAGVAVFTDITELRQAEERQRLLLAAASVLLNADNPDSLLQGIFSELGPQLGLDTYFNFMVDETGQYLQLKSFTGIPEEEAQRISRLEFGEAVCGNVALRQSPIIMTSIQESQDPIVHLVKGYGIHAYACNPLMNNGRLIGTLSFASRSKESFSALELEFFETISRYVTAAYERLRLIKELREASRRKDEFLAMLAHELRNPLAPVRNAVQVLRHVESSNPHAQQMREIIDRQVTHLTQLVDDLLDVSRITRGKISLRRERIDLTTVISRAVETSRPLINAGHHQLNVTLPSEPVYVAGDLTRLAQVISNLLNNAAKYTEPGGQIALLIEREESEVVIRLHDNGIGIQEKDLPHIFDLFAQADRSLDRTQGGLGIGLTLVKKIVELHDGRIEAHSDGPGKGSEFVIRLPLFHEDLPEPQILSTPLPDKTPNDSPDRRYRILVVDDNIDSAGSMALLLGFERHQVKIAFNGLEALQIAQEFHPQIVLLDIGLPAMDGYEVARQLRKDSLQPLVLIAITGYGQAEDRARTKAAGFDHHFTKPVEYDRLIALINSYQR